MNASTSNGAGGVLIVGGGLVGASLAIALDAAGVPAMLAEAAPPRGDVAPADERNLALSRATVNGLRAIGAWPHAAAHAMPIRHIHVSRAGDFGSVRLNAAREGVDALGWTVPASKLGVALAQRLAQCMRLQCIAPAQVAALDALPHGWRATLCTEHGEHTVEAALVVGADGTESFVRHALGIEAEVHDYAQTLVVASIATAKPPAQRAWERFTDDGPVAVLPLADGRCGLVLTIDAARAGEIAAMGDAAFLALAQRRFGARLGRWSRPGRRYLHPIRRVAATQLVGPRAVLIGNAAQTIHPIGAQGFNLGLRDALTLAELLAAAPDPGDASLLASYAARRADDRAGTLAMSHGLARLACLPLDAFSPLRSLAMLALDRVPPLRSALARRGMGFRPHAPDAVLESLP